MSNACLTDQRVTWTKDAWRYTVSVLHEEDDRPLPRPGQTVGSCGVSNVRLRPSQRHCWMAWLF